MESNEIQKPVVQKPQSESMELNELFGALAKTQGELEVAKTTSKNPFFKSSYADLSQIVKASRPYLAKNGLAVIQRVLTNGGGQMYLFTRLCHSSGQWIESKMPINPPKNDIQSIGSYLTYLRRYNWAAIVGVTASEEDDDGEAAMERKPKNELTAMEVKELSKLLKKVSTTRQRELLDFAQANTPYDVTRDKLKILTAKLTKEIGDIANG
jgi:hypothetical protein